MGDGAEYLMFAEEIGLARLGFSRVAGVDEAGRGPLAGPVVAAAVVFPPWSEGLAASLSGIDDSKRLTPARREALLPLIEENALAIGLCRVEPKEIERLNILQATMKAMAGGYARIKRGDKLYGQDPDKLTARLKQQGAMAAALKWIRKNESVDSTIVGMTDFEELAEDVRSV